MKESKIIKLAKKLTSKQEAKSADENTKEKELIEYWTKKYKININQKKLGAVFFNYFSKNSKFKDYLLRSKTMHIVLDQEYSYKEFILWANTLFELKIIDIQCLNDFMLFLQTNSPEEIKENNKSVRQLTDAETMVFDLAQKNLDALDAAFRNAIASEMHCAKIVAETQPVGDNYDKYYRIVEVIARYDGAWKHTQYEGKAPETTKPATDPLDQVYKLK